LNEPNLRDIATGLRFPEGPVALADGSFLVVEIEAGRVSRVSADGVVSTLADTGGGPNGAALGPDGRVYICNNGGMAFHYSDGLILPGHGEEGAATGWIDAIDLKTGAVETLYRACNGRPLIAPNDLVFDSAGGFYFTDHGKARKYDRDRGGVYYANADGSHINRVWAPMEGPNGIGLSPDGETLYVAETPTGRLWAFNIISPGKIDRAPGPAPWQPGRLLANPAGYHMFDSLAVDVVGDVWIGTIPNGLTRVSPSGGVTYYPMPDLLPTNICFDARGQAYVTLSSQGRLAAFDPD
jgi:gluconolactonase